MKKTERILSFFEVFRVMAAVLLAYLISLVIISLISTEPLAAIRHFIVGPFERLSRIGDMVALAIPLVFTGLCMCFMHAVNKFNLSGEGIFIFSGCIITWVSLMLGDNVPQFIMIPLLLLIGAAAGACISAFPAFLNIKFNANVVVVSLMLNTILMYFTQYVMKFVIKDTSLAITATLPLPKAALLSRIIPGTTIHQGIFIALACVLIVMMIFYKTPFGYSMRTVGFNPNFAFYAGMGVNGVVLMSQVIGGIFAGLGGAVEIMGRYTRFQWTSLTNHGFDGLMVAVLAYKNPALVPVGALLLAYIRIGADIVNRSTDISPEFVSIIQGIIILLIAAEMFLSGLKRRLIFKAAKEELKNK
ncbi:MAG: ABC transporter permease [Treponema sp.]|jgi:simple sugar transport system permease protein|nr:ABC transporter permease [Treponema sp.]